MSFPDRKYFQEIAAQSLFQVDKLEKVYRLCYLLEKIFLHPTFGKMLVLRGGTALNFLHLDLPRLSVDIDLDFIGGITKEEMEKLRPQLDTALKRIFVQEGYEIKPIEEYALVQYYLNYTNTIPQQDQIKVEINYLNRVPLLGVDKRLFTVSQFDWGLDFSIQALKLEELTASKVVTLLARAYPRDMYDIYQLKSLEKLDIELINKLAICLGCIEEKNFLDLGPEIIDKITFHDVKRELLPLLRKRERIDLNQMKAETKRFVKLVLQKDQKIVQFLMQFYQGNFAPDAILANYKTNPDLKSHPGARWRLQNLTKEQKEANLEILHEEKLD